MGGTQIEIIQDFLFRMEMNRITIFSLPHVCFFCFQNSQQYSLPLILRGNTHPPEPDPVRWSGYSPLPLLPPWTEQDVPYLSRQVFQDYHTHMLYSCIVEGWLKICGIFTFHQNHAHTVCWIGTTIGWSPTQTTEINTN